jgi:hypothetical protein
VILQAGTRRDRAQRYLDSLLRQEAIGRMEILLLDYAAHSHGPLAGSEHPCVRRVKRDALEPFGQGRALAVGAAEGRVVAFIEDHCLAHAGWADSILAAHDRGWAGVGPEMHNANPGVGISDGVHLVNYARWLPPAEAGESDLIVGHNSSYLRSALLRYGVKLSTLLRCDVVLQWRLIRDGGTLGVSPDVKVSHMNETDIASLIKGAFLWNRMFAPTRAEAFGWSSARLLLWLLLTPLIPVVRSVRLLAWTSNRRRALLGAYLKNLPLLLVTHTAAAAGQIVGLAAGLGDAEVEFLRYEITQERLSGSDDRTIQPG